jgi:hypothetical protein
VSNFPSIPDPQPEVNVLAECVRSLKQIAEVLTRQRGKPAQSSVVWQDLVDLGLITETQIPKK